MKLTILRAADQAYNQWSGGKTAQLEIFPPDAVYSEQNFIYRVSTATIDALESDFTKLPNYSRKLMLLEGEVCLEIENDGSYTLKPFEPVSFSGAVHVHSVGKCTDFNLMTNPKAAGTLEAIVFDSTLKHNLLIENNLYTLAIYVVSGVCEFFIENEKISLAKNDYFSLQNANKIQQIALAAKLNSALAIVKIWLK